LILENGGVSGKLSLPPRKDVPEMAKPIEDQFGFIGKVAGDILRLSPVLHEALT
jgi:hypothetical protein